MKTKGQSDEANRTGLDLLPPLAVRVIRYDRQRLRLVQHLILPSALLTALAKAFDSLLALGLLLLLAGVCIGLYASARQSESAQIRAFSGRIKVARLTVDAGEFGRWRCRGQAATAFALGSNLRVVPSSVTDAESLRVMLQTVLGDPLRYRPRGTGRARRVAASIAVAGAVMMYLAFGF